MLILGIETATASVGCALGDNSGVLASVSVTRGRRHVETLVPAIEFMCAQAGVRLDQVSAIAVDVGPGLFSGLRVGVATAKAMAQALRVPTVGVASLDLLAFPVRHTRRLIVAAIDARRGEVFHAWYRPVPGGVQRVSPYRLDSPDDVAADLLADGNEFLLVGDQSVLRSEILAGETKGEGAGGLATHPSASALVELAHPRAVREEFVPAEELRPLYLRNSDAQINWDASAARRGPRSESVPSDAAGAVRRW